MNEGHTGRLEAALAGRYKIERKLGEGGMASVYLAEDIKHGRNVALKILRPELAAVIGSERFLSEIRTTTATLSDVGLGREHRYCHTRLASRSCAILDW